MRKVNFVSSLNAKLVLAVSVVAGFTLAGCEKEDFSVNVPDINITVPEVEIPEAADGVAYVNLSATSASGNTLDGVTFKDGSGNTLAASTKYTSATTFTVTASKEGYTTVVKTVTVPTLQKGAYVVIPVDFVLTAIEESAAPVQGDEVEDAAPVVANSTDTYAGPFEAGKSYTLAANVPSGTYYTEAQITALLSAVDALTGPVTRATDEESAANLELAKKYLREIINALPTTWGTTKQSVTITVTDAANAVTFAYTITAKTFKVTIQTSVANETYVVEGEQLVIDSVEILPTAEGVEIGHDHGHDSHGDDSNAGGGTTGK